MDLTAFTQMLNALGLAQLGPWGLPVGVGIVLLVIFLKRRFGVPSPSTQPSPTPSPATQPSILSGIAPLLHDALAALGLIPKTGATVNDVPHAAVVQLTNDLDALTNAKVAAHTAALADLKPSDPAPAAAPTPVAGKL